MSFFNQYPYLNINDLNLDFILNAIKEMRNEVTNFVSINAIKYADPIQWDITRQYEKNTVVIDPVTGTAYISIAPVPAGVALTRAEYWTVVFDLGSFVTRAAQNFTSRWESDTTTTATFATPAGAWLVWGDVLYKALVNITAGDTYVIGSNIEHFTIEDLYNVYLNTIDDILTMVGNLADLTTSDASSIVNAINSVLDDLNLKIGNLNELKTATTTDIVHAINSVSNAINVLEVGFDNTGTIDNSAAFNSLSSGIYFLPNGTYKVDGSVTLNHDITLIGESINDTIISLSDNVNSEIITANDTNVLIANLSIINLRTDTNHSGTLNCLGNAIIEKCYIETHSLHKIAVAFNGSYQNRYVVNNCEINGNGGNGNFGIWCDSTSGLSNVCILSVSNCFIHGFNLNGVFSTARAGRYTNNRFLDNHYQTSPTGGGQIDVLSNNVVPLAVHLIENNIFEAGGAGACGVEISNCKAIVKNNVIYGGSLTNTHHNGVVVQMSTDSIIEGNIFQECYSGVQVVSDACANIINNTFYAMGMAGCIHIDTELNDGNMIVGNISKLSQPVITYYGTNRPLYDLFGVNSALTVGMQPDDSVTFKLPKALSTTDDNYFIVIMFDNELDTIYAMYDGTIFRDSNKMQTLSITRNDDELTLTSSAVGGRLLAIKLL